MGLLLQGGALQLLLAAPQLLSEQKDEEGDVEVEGGDYFRFANNIYSQSDLYCKPKNITIINRSKCTMGVKT